MASSGDVGLVDAGHTADAVGRCTVSGLSDFEAHANQALRAALGDGAWVVGHLAFKTGKGHRLGFVLFSSLSSVSGPSQQSVVEAFGVLSQDGHVHHAGFPNLTEATVDLVGHTFVEFDRSHIGVEIQAAAQAEDDRPTGEIAVGQPSAGIANGTEKDGVRFVFANVERALGPFFTGGHVVFTAAGNDGLVKPVIRVFLDGIQDALGLQRHFSTRPVAWQNRDAMVTHGLSHMALLHERDPRSTRNLRALTAMFRRW